MSRSGHSAPALRPVFRALAWALGPMLLAAGLLLAVLDLIGRRPRNWPPWSQPMHLGFWLGVGNFIVGLIILKTARSGRDHYNPVSDDPARERSTPEG